MLRLLTAAAIAALVGSIALAFFVRTTVASAIALTVGGIACVALVSIAFYAVGASEDRERADRATDGSP